MRSGSVIAALATGLLIPRVFGAAINLDVCSVETVLEYFTCLRPIPEGCFDNLTEQATAWCADYLSIDMAPVTVYRSTVAPLATEIVTETATAVTTATEIDVTTVEESQTTTKTDVVEVIVTETVTVEGATMTVKRRTITSIASSETTTASASETESLTTTATATAAPSCVDLSKKNLLRHPAAKLSKACSCINPQPTTVTLDATTVDAVTTTATETSTVTVIVSETTVATELVTTVATEDVTVTQTSTATATATQTPTYDPCAHRFTLSDGSTNYGTLTNVPGVATGYECCQLCYKTESCAFAISSKDGQCAHAILPAYELDFPSDDQCKYGWMSFHKAVAAENGPIYKGPCYLNM